MKSVTKTYTNSTGTKLTVDSGLTDAQMAGLYCMYITAAPGADGLIGVYYVNPTAAQIGGNANNNVSTQFSINFRRDVGYNKVVIGNAISSISATFYYFE